MKKSKTELNPQKVRRINYQQTENSLTNLKSANDPTFLSYSTSKSPPKRSRDLESSQQLEV